MGHAKHEPHEEPALTAHGAERIAERSLSVWAIDYVIGYGIQYQRTGVTMHVLREIDPGEVSGFAAGFGASDRTWHQKQRGRVAIVDFGEQSINGAAQPD